MNQTQQHAGIDAGYGYTKALAEDRAVVFPSVAGPAIEISYRSDLNGKHADDMTLEAQGQRTFVGDLARRQSPTPRSPLGRQRDLGFVLTLARAALYRLGLTTGEIHMTTGLPVEWYADHAALATVLRGRHVYSVNGAPCDTTITPHVVPQPFGALFREMIDADGVLADPDHLRTARVAVVDIGAGTTDYAVSDALEFIQAQSGSIPIAAAAIYQHLQRILAAEPYQLDLDLRAVEAATRAGGWVSVAGSRVNIASHVQEATAAVARPVLDWMTEKWGNGRQFDRILVAGGGAHLLAAAIRESYPHAVEVADAQMANVTGFYRLALLRSRMD